MPEKPFFILLTPGVLRIGSVQNEVKVVIFGGGER